MKRYLFPWLSAAALVACGDDTPTPTLDTVEDTTPGPDIGDGTGGPVSIVSFGTNFESITRGRDSRGQMVEGGATLAWRTEGATSVALLVDGLPIALDGCVAEEGETCASAGSIVVKPAANTTFTLRADGACEGPCPEASVAVAVMAPARLELDESVSLFAPGTDVALAYTMSGATEFSLGLATNDGDGGIMLDACAPADAPADAPCTVDHEAGADPASGTLRIDDVQRGFTIGVNATNGADDGLGDISLGDLLVAYAVPVVVHAFTTTPAAFLPGDEVVLAWEVAGAQSVSVATDATFFTGLSTCVGLGADGRGFCTLTADGSAPLGAVPFTLTALQDTGVSGEASARAEVIGGPRIDAFMADLSEAALGQSLVLSWTAFGAEIISVTGTSGAFDGLDACTAIAADGSGSCVVTVASGAPLGEASLTLTAAHGMVGPAAMATAPVTLTAPPVVTAFAFDDATLRAGDNATLMWTVEHADSVLLRDESGTFAQELLDACGDGMTGDDGMCMLAIPAGLPPGDITFTLTAIGSTGARSADATAVLSIGEAPSPTLTVTPAMLPEGGGTVTLAWTAATATHVIVSDSAPTPNTIVDTGVGSTCSGNEPCDPVGDSVAVAAVQPGTYTLRAENAFGTGFATASVSIEGAPLVTSLTFAGTGVMDGPVAHGTAAGALAWSVDNIDEGDLIRLERAATSGADASCADIAPGSWSPVATFPRDGEATGTATVDGLTRIAECFRFTAEDTDATPVQRDTVSFKVYRNPVVTRFGADDQTVRHGDRVRLDWESALSWGVRVSVTPVGAVSSQELAVCNAPSGACTVTIQAGTPAGDVVFSLEATGENGSVSAAQTVRVTVGTGASLQRFGADPTSASAVTDVTLSWATQDGTSLVIREGASTIFSSEDAAVIAAGSHTVPGVATTRSWVLTVENAFGSASAQVTTFVGPSIDSLTVNGGDALDGDETIFTGPATIAWSTTSADGSHRLESAAAPASGNCTADASGWATVYLKASSPADSASHTDAAVTANRCYRLTVTNAQTPPQTSQAVFFVREVPEIATMTASPGSLPASGGTVILDMGIRGATALSVSAQYRDASGGVLGTRAVCTQSTLNAGRLTGGTGVDEVECAHRIVPCNLLCLNNGMPSGTASVRYVLNVSDEEGDAASRTTSGNEDVSID